jgi:hypothetical protein
MRVVILASVVLGMSAGAAMPVQSATSSYFSSATAGRLLAAHNRERARVGVAPLRWDPSLAAAAASYGRTLARIGTLRHSSHAAQLGQLENLWMGTRGAYSPEQMVGYWVAEKANYYPGRFPHVSRTGNWADVAHYTQVVWSGTTHVGCAIHPSVNWDYLICRYSPPGNVLGRRAA